MKRLTKWVDGKVAENHDNDATAEEFRDGNKFRNGSNEIMQRLAHYEDLEEQGWLVILPCKVGDKVWILPTNYNGQDGIVHREVVCLYLDDLNEGTAVCNNQKLKIKDYSASFDNFGTVAFLTEDEAKKALKERKND